MTNCYICKKDLGASDVFTSLGITSDVQLRERLKNQLGVSENDIIRHSCTNRIHDKFKEKKLVNIADVKPNISIIGSSNFHGIIRWNPNVHCR